MLSFLFTRFTLKRLILISHQRQSVYIHEFSFLATYMGTLTVVFAFAAVVSVCVEMPFLNLNYLLTQAYTDKAQQECSMH